MPQRDAVELVVGVVDVRADPPDDAAVAAGEEQLRLAVLEERVEARAQEQPALDPQRGRPLGRGSMQPVRELDELPSVPARAERARPSSATAAHPTCPRPASTSSRRPARTTALEQLRAAREADVLPYFRTLDGPARARSSRWRAPSGSCSAPTTTSGLTADERVVQGAQDALDDATGRA